MDLSFEDTCLLYLALIQLSVNVDFVDKKVLLMKKLAKETYDREGECITIWKQTGALD